METTNKHELADFTDRELLELTFATVLHTDRKLENLESFVMSKYKKEYLEFLNRTALSEDINEVVNNYHPTLTTEMEIFLSPDGKPLDR